MYAHISTDWRIIETSVWCSYYISTHCSWVRDISIQNNSHLIRKCLYTRLGYGWFLQKGLGGILCVKNKKLGCGIESIDPITEILTPFFLRYGAKAFACIFPHSSIIVKNKQRTHNWVNVHAKEQELIPEYGVNIFRACVRPCVRPSMRPSVRPPTDKCRVCILCVKQHSFLVF